MSIEGGERTIYLPRRFGKSFSTNRKTALQVWGVFVFIPCVGEYWGMVGIFRSTGFFAGFYFIFVGVVQTNNSRFRFHLFLFIWFLRKGDVFLGDPN